jgi:hypothetical protein
MVGVLEPLWQRYVSHTGRSVVESGQGFQLRSMRSDDAPQPTDRSWVAVLRLLHHEVYRLLVNDAVMESDLNFADAHQDYRYIEALCGECGPLWPIQRLNKAMAHHLHATLAAQRLYRSLSEDAIDRAADLNVESARAGNESRWLAHRWGARRASASAHQLSAFLDDLALEHPVSARASRARRSF